MNLIKELVNKVQSSFLFFKNWIVSKFANLKQQIKKKKQNFKNMTWNPEGSEEALKRIKEEGKLSIKLYFLIWYYQFYYRQLRFGRAESEIYSIISAIIFFIFIFPKILEYYFGSK